MNNERSLATLFPALVQLSGPIESKDLIPAPLRQIKQFMAYGLTIWFSLKTNDYKLVLAMPSRPKLLLQNKQSIPFAIQQGHKLGLSVIFPFLSLITRLYGLNRFLIDKISLLIEQISLHKCEILLSLLSKKVIIDQLLRAMVVCNN